MSVYTVPSAAASYTALLPHFLPPRSALLQTLVVIVLDWTRPWTFVEELETWLSWVEQWAKGDGSRVLCARRAASSFSAALQDQKEDEDEEEEKEINALAGLFYDEGCIQLVRLGEFEMGLSSSAVRKATSILVPRHKRIEK